MWPSSRFGFSRSASSDSSLASWISEFSSPAGACRARLVRSSGSGGISLCKRLPNRNLHSGFRRRHLGSDELRPRTGLLQFCFDGFIEESRPPEDSAHLTDQYFAIAPTEIAGDEGCGLSQRRGRR